MSSENTQGVSPNRLIILAGPTAVGKGKVSAYIRVHYPDVSFSVSVTTRPIRPGEREGFDYFFTDDATFDRMIQHHEFLEYATVHGVHRYGTLKEKVEHELQQGKSLVLEIDLQGARMVKAAMPDAVLVFLLPPSWEELVRRLLERGTENEEEQCRRLETARVELAQKDESDYQIINYEVAQAAQEVVKLVYSDGI